jgi:5-formyltetrahydrofolate cyclo-ligase
MTPKEILRKELRGIDGCENVETLFANLTSLIKWESKPIIAGYWPIAGEIDDLAFLKHCHNQGLQCCLPFIKSEAAPLIFKAWQPSDILEKGMYGIPAPSPEAPILIPDVLLIPLVAFDRACYRLGKGGGFYDRTLAHLRENHDVLAIGLAYDCQEIDRVTREAHDQQLDCIVTPTRVVYSS